MTFTMLRAISLSAWRSAIATKIDIVFIGVMIGAGASLLFDSGLMYAVGCPLVFLWVYCRYFILECLGLNRLNVLLRTLLDELGNFETIIPRTVNDGVPPLIVPMGTDSLGHCIWLERSENRVVGTDFDDAADDKKPTIRLAVNQTSPIMSINVEPMKGIRACLTSIEKFMMPLSPNNSPDSVRCVKLLSSDASITSSEVPRISESILDIRLEQFTKQLIELDPYMALTMALEDLK